MRGLCPLALLEAILADLVSKSRQADLVANSINLLAPDLLPDAAGQMSRCTNDKLATDVLGASSPPFGGVEDAGKRTGGAVGVGDRRLGGVALPTKPKLSQPGQTTRIGGDSGRS